MGVCNGKTKSVTSQRIDDQINNHKKIQRTEIKILLLGGGESGKSTFAKQIKIIHMGGFGVEERMHFKEVIHENVMYSVRSLITAAAKMNIDLSKKNKPIAERLLEISTVELDEELGRDIKSCYNDESIKQVISNYRSFHLLDSAEYFLSNIDRIVTPDYTPTVDDLLRCRAKTTGIQELQIEIQRNLFIIVDVGGQRSERKKWIHCFQDVTAVLFFVALSEYDLKLYEDEDTNRMHESLKLFDEISNSKWFSHVPIILFLNKSDIFREKIEKVNITEAFPDYEGPQEFEAASEFIQQQFIALNENPEKAIYTHITCATNTENIRLVFDSVRTIVIQAAITLSGF